MRRVSLYLLAFGLIPACKESPDPAPGPAPKALNTRLAGSPLERVSDGAWVLRRGPATGGAGAARPGGPAVESAATALPAEKLATLSGSGDGPGAEGMPASDLAPADPAAPEAGLVHVRGEARQAAAPALRAGATDDNADYDAFLTFLGSCAEAGPAEGRYLPLDVSGRRYVRVTDAKGRPRPGAEVRVVDVGGDRVLWAGRTMGDGRLPFYPVLAGHGVGRRVLVEVGVGEARSRAAWDVDKDLTVAVDAAELGGPVVLDVVFLIDTTGSMGDEIDAIKRSLAGVTQKLRSLEREFSLRYGAVLYRDVGDEYVTKAHPFTKDLGAFDSALAGIRADGGGDGPESLNQGLAVAVHGMDWRPEAAKLVFLVADAQPHLDYEDDIPYTATIRDALRLGIKVHAVAASGLPAEGTIVFRQVAQLTRGKFIFIEYGSTKASAEGHGVAGEVKSNNLDDILFEQCRDEIAGWGR